MTHIHDFVKDLDGQITCATCGAKDNEKELELQKGIANALWAGYEESLPDTPGRMAKLIISYLNAHGYKHG
tara:strand:+ start:1687 stop:1899 length:213 start_codon:yes stop_codon:yes gene_type:complete